MQVIFSNLFYERLMLFVETQRTLKSFHPRVHHDWSPRLVSKDNPFRDQFKGSRFQAKEVYTLDALLCLSSSKTALIFSLNSFELNSAIRGVVEANSSLEI